MKTSRMPVVYVPHGGGPWPWMEEAFGDPEELSGLAEYLRSIAQLPPVAPAAVLCVTAHWEERVPTVSSGARPPMLYDYSGFPEDTYRIQWPAPGSPSLAARVQQLLGEAGIPSAADPERGYDHGTFVPLKLAYPDAQVPTVQLSLKRGLEPQEHLAIGRAIAPLRDEGVFIVASGLSFHNLRAFGPRAAPVATAFDGWLQRSVPLPPKERDEALARWAEAPMARQAHPREEHLLPLMVAAGAAGADAGSVAYRRTLMGLPVSGYRFG
jgi:aromatic ring-opening dioxygenase catalytic subunit (LigB family)